MLKKNKKLYLAQVRKRYPSAYRLKEHEDGSFTVFMREPEGKYGLTAIRCRIKLKIKVDTN